MNQTTPLTPDELYNDCDLSGLPFETTTDLDGFSEIIGQARALEAIHFGIGIQQPGFNLFALGPNGTGKFTTIESFLAEKAPGLPTPRDWCYVHNFDTPHRPTAIGLPAGRGVRLRDTMSKLAEDINTVLPAAFNSEEYAAQRKQIEEGLKEQEMEALEALHNEARTQDVALLRTPAGFAFAPLKGEEVMAPDEFRQLTPAEQKAIEDKINGLQEKLQKVMRQVPQWQRTVQGQLKQLNERVALYALEPLFAELRQAFDDLPTVLAYIDTVQKDLLDNVEEFMGQDENPMAMMMGGRPRGAVAERYRVNLLVDHSADNGAPVVYEPLPTYQNLVGRVEHISQMGTLVTDYMLIKPGALHRANGGYLILDMRKLLEQPYAWEGLKNALRTREIRIESLGQLFSYISTVSLEPEAIALDVKVVLMGERQLYYLLCQYDPDFPELFKVSADFEDDMPRDDASSVAYARTIASIGRKTGLRPFAHAAVARVIEHGSRLAGDASKLSTHMQTVSDLLREADFWAGEAGHAVVTRADVDRALQAQEYRAGRIRERMQEAITRETILIDTDGAVVGQINALAVYTLGDFAFGKPSRITARVRLGRGEVIDIERRVELGGPLHAKGVLILSSYLMAKYAFDQPFAISATLVFEQSYGGVDGDSASSTELYALLSALADVPIRQGLAVTGSVNQRGQVQAIGGVNEKIEGFFDLCVARGLTGDQGVLIPRANVKHLMLHQRVVDAVRDGRFHIYPVETIDRGIELLTGVAAGALDAERKYPAESINGRIMQRLEAFMEKQRRLNRRPGEKAANGVAIGAADGAPDAPAEEGNGDG